MKKWLKLKIMGSIFTWQFIVGCTTAISPTPNSEKIQILSKVKKGCKNLGSINTNEVAQESFDSDASLHDMNLTLLKNKALVLGANAILITNHLTSKQNQLVRLKAGPRTVKVSLHAMNGTAYYCSN